MEALHLGPEVVAASESMAAHDAFLAFAFAAFFRLLRIMTTLKNDPTTAEPSSMRMTGIRIAQTRGGKSEWSV